MRKLIFTLLLLPIILSANITLDGPPGTTSGGLCGAVANCPIWTQVFASNATHIVVSIGFYAGGGDLASVTIGGGLLTCTSVRAYDGAHAATSITAICPLLLTGSRTVEIALNTGPAGGWSVKVQSVIGAPSTSYVDGTSNTSVFLANAGTATTSVTTASAGSWCFSTALLAGTSTGIGFGAGETQIGTPLVNSPGYLLAAAYKPDNTAGAVTQTTTFTSTAGGYAAQSQMCLKPITYSTGGSVVRKRVIVTGGV